MSKAKPAAAPDTQQPVVADLKFAEALRELEGIVQSMENGQLALEDAILAYNRGATLLTHCQAQLSAAEQKIQVLDNGALKKYDPGHPQ